MPTVRRRNFTLETSGEECCAMYQFLKENPPDCVIEIGMAYGVSSLAF